MTDMDGIEAKEIPESVIDLMVKTIEKWMEADGQLRSREGLDTTPDTHMMQIPCNFWPTHGMFQAWVTTLKSNNAALRKAKADGMREAALIAGHSKIITHNVVLHGETIPSTEWCRDPNAQEIAAAINAAASKLADH